MRPRIRFWRTKSRREGLPRLRYGIAVGVFAGQLFAVHTELAVAAPAPWYLWQSTSTQQKICKQVSPGDGWILFAGPFRNGACRH